MIIQADNILSLLQAYPLQLDHYGYGTAGFRYAATFMAPVMVRVGLVSRLLLGQQHMGVMITASHNDESYNGVKISNPDGSMIGPDQESLLVDWVNERSLDKWSQKLTELSTTCTSLGNLHIGRDTRSHSLGFSNLVIQAAEAMAIKVVNHGVVTTPMLHHIVLYSNTPQSETLASRQGYLQQLAQAYIAMDKILNPSSIVKSPLQVDGACGVGYQATVDLQSTLTELDPHYADRFQPRNSPSVGPLNHDCGSEHVQKQLKPPTWYDQVHDVSVTYCCSVDGDADRIVFFAEPWMLLDGDKIAVFIAHFFQTLLQQGELPSDLSLGVVQTAYANGASTAYLQNTLQLPVVITKTGVKHLHHAAMQFDIGIYFEANGHGTVLFSPKYHQTVQTPLLQYLPKLINPAVGDALSDFLLVDLLLRYFNWSLQDWDTKLYTDLPSRQLKVSVKDRSIIHCNDNETQATAPATLQPLLEQAMSGVGRCFVRPSGTENVVRVYAEASTRPLADELATKAAQIIYETCQGVDPVPKI